MKKLMVCALVGLVAASVSAQDLSQGRKEIGLSGNIKLDEPDPIDYQVDVDVKYGYFVRDRIQVGGNFGISANDQSWTLTLGPYAEYNFDLGERWPNLSKVVPFVGAGIALATAELKELEVKEGEGVRLSKDKESSTGVALNGETGLKYFISDSVAITASFDFSWSTDDVFGGRSSAKNILLGLRAYF